MKNFEKFEKEIMEIIESGHTFAVVNGKPVNCMTATCNSCELQTNSCFKDRYIWMFSEYKERPKLTKQERKFCELFEGKDVWFAIDESCQFCMAYTEKPIKRDFHWTGHYIQIANIIDFIGVKFDFIKWEDKEPWSIEELLKLEVEE